MMARLTRGLALLRSFSDRDRQVSFTEVRQFWNWKVVSNRTQRRSEPNAWEWRERSAGIAATKLFSGASLAHAGVSNGAFLLARLPDPPAAAAGSHGAAHSAVATNMPAATAPPPLPAAPEEIAARVAALAPSLGGAAWTVDLKRSEPMMPFMLAMGAPWLIVQAIKASGEPVAKRTFSLNAGGLRDEIVTSGVLGRREVVEWTWAQFMRASPIGSSPACLGFDGEGRLRLVAQHGAKALLVTSTLSPVEPDSADPSRDLLAIVISVADAAGKEVLRLKRIFTRPRTA